jgi:hypothetical protein
VVTDITWLNEQDNLNIQHSIKQLHDNVQVLRSAGKLAGNTQAALINNDRERASELSQL